MATGLAELKNPEILSVGLSDAIYFSAIQVFMFIWTPILQDLANSKWINTGMIFILMMLSALCQNKVLDILHKVLRINYFVINVAYLCMFGGAFFALYSSSKFALSVGILTLINGSFGMYVPVLGYMRAVLLKEKQRALMMNIFKIPFNLIVITLLLLSGYFDPYFIAMITSCILACSVCCGIYLYVYYLKNSGNIEMSLNISDTSRLTQSSK